MFHRVDYKNEPRLKPLTKGLSNYDKLQKDLNTPVKDYNQIKDLVELDAHQSLASIRDARNKPHELRDKNSITKLNNINNKKSKNTVEIGAHKKGKNKK